MTINQLLIVYLIPISCEFLIDRLTAGVWVGDLFRWRAADYTLTVGAGTITDEEYYYDRRKSSGG